MISKPSNAAAPINSKAFTISRSLPVKKRFSTKWFQFCPRNNDCSEIECTIERGAFLEIIYGEYCRRFSREIGNKIEVIVQEREEKKINCHKEEVISSVFSWPFSVSNTFSMTIKVNPTFLATFTSILTVIIHSHTIITVIIKHSTCVCVCIEPGLHLLIHDHYSENVDTCLPICH